jgi:hypothetical protein
MMTEPRVVFIVELVAGGGVSAPIKQLRLALKSLRRQHGLIRAVGQGSGPDWN